MTSSRNLGEIGTSVARLFWLAVALAVMGAWFLPWIRLDGESQGSSGAGLVVIVVSPAVEYLFEVSQLQTAILIGGSALFIVSATMMMKYVRWTTAPVATCLALGSSLGVVYGAPDLTTKSEFGVLLTVVLASVLITHHVLIQVQRTLYRLHKLPMVYQSLAVLTGTGRR